MYGGLRRENIPGAAPATFDFPTTHNAATTFTPDKGPYIEAGAGITRIFKVLRIDVLRRLTYLNHTNINEWSIRWGLQLEL